MTVKTTWPLGSILNDAVRNAINTRQYLSDVATQLAGNITGNDALTIASVIRNNIGNFNLAASSTGMLAYAKNEYQDDTYDAPTEYSALVTALNAVLSWLNTNIPADAVSVSNGSLVAKTYTPAQTAPLLTLVNAAIATVDLPA